MLVQARLVLRKLSSLHDFGNYFVNEIYIEQPLSYDELTHKKVYMPQQLFHASNNLNNQLLIFSRINKSQDTNITSLEI